MKKAMLAEHAHELPVRTTLPASGESRRSEFSGWRAGLIFAVTVVGLLARAEAATPTQTTLTVCANQPIPAGYVVTALSKTKACGAGLVAWNTMTLKAYQGVKSIKVCAPLQDIPQGYIVTAQATTTTCKGGQGGLVPWNTMTLTAYAGLASFNACMPLPAIPPGYVVTAQTRTAACSSAPGLNTVTVKRV